MGCLGKHIVACVALLGVLLFDCDGILVEIERNGHKINFNKVFEEGGVKFRWEVALYGKLLKIGEGNERMTHYLNNTTRLESMWTKDLVQMKEFVARMHKRNTKLFMDMVETG